MKYTILCLATLFSFSWHWFQSESSNRNKQVQTQIQGKVSALEGNLTLKIDDNYITVRSFDRFNLQTQQAAEENLHIEIIDQPIGQKCNLLKQKKSEQILMVNITCQTIERELSLNG